VGRRRQEKPLQVSTTTVIHFDKRRAKAERALGLGRRVLRGSHDLDRGGEGSPPEEHADLDELSHRQRLRAREEHPASADLHELHVHDDRHSRRQRVLRLVTGKSSSLVRPFAHSGDAASRAMNRSISSSIGGSTWRNSSPIRYVCGRSRPCLT